LINGSKDHILGWIFDRYLLSVKPSHELLKTFVALLVQ